MDVSLSDNFITEAKFISQEPFFEDWTENLVLCVLVSPEIIAHKGAIHDPIHQIFHNEYALKHTVLSC